MAKKYLTEAELLEFIDWCKRNKITQKEIAELCGVHEQWVSKTFTARRFKRNKNFKGDVKKMKKPQFERARARLVILTKKNQALEELIALGKKRGYKDSWAHKIFNFRKQKQIAWQQKN